MLFERQQTGTTPSIKFDIETNSFLIEGRSLAEDAATFYGELLDWITENLTGSGTKAEIVIKLDYCNTSSFLGMGLVLRKIKELNEDGCAFTVRWQYDHDDEDWLEDGENFQEAVGIPFVFEAI